QSSAPPQPFPTHYLRGLRLRQPPAPSADRSAPGGGRRQGFRGRPPRRLQRKTVADNPVDPGGSQTTFKGNKDTNIHRMEESEMYGKENIVTASYRAHPQTTLETAAAVFEEECRRSHARDEFCSGARRDAASATSCRRGSFSPTQLTLIDFIAQFNRHAPLGCTVGRCKVGEAVRPSPLVPPGPPPPRVALRRRRGASAGLASRPVSFGSGRGRALRVPAPAPRRLRAAAAARASAVRPAT
ncbi:Protein of unknown function, partial [Gryllus bimaculatus]